MDYLPFLVLQRFDIDYKSFVASDAIEKST